MNALMPDPTLMNKLIMAFDIVKDCLGFHLTIGDLIGGIFVENAFDDRCRRLAKSQRRVSLSVTAFNCLQAGTLVAQQFARLPRLLPAHLAQIDVGPAGEAVLQVPRALPMAEQHDLVHESPSVHVSGLRCRVCR